MSDTRAVVFLNSYATGTEKLQITKMKTRSPAVISGICDCSPVSVTAVIKPLICVLCSQCCSFCLLKSG